MMKVIHVPFCYYPDPVGGTEIYVEALARALKADGLEVVIAAPGEANLAYDYEGMYVRRFKLGAFNDVRDIYDTGDISAAEAFGQMLDEEKPDIIHLHAFTRGVSLRLVEEAKRRGIKIIFTYHTPTVSCTRGTLLRWGNEICDGKLDHNLCTRCTLHGKGLQRDIAEIIGRIPVRASRMLGNLHVQGNLWTGLRMHDLIDLRHKNIHMLTREVDHIVAVCNWVRDVLLINAVPEEKITVSRHGLANIPLPTNERTDMNIASPRPLNIAYAGRIDSTKGPDVLVRALQLMPEAPVELHIYGVIQNVANDKYFDELKSMITTDPRIMILPPVPNTEMIQVLKKYDLLAVPSQCLETGPLVILEAFAAGIPVVGSRLGGIRELVQDGVNGLLVEPASPKCWMSAFEQILTDPMLLPKLKNGIHPPRSINDVASDMLNIYSRIYKGLKTA